MDRVRAVRFGVKSVQHLETFAGQSHNEIDDDAMSTAIIGIQGAKVLFSPMEDVEKKKTDWSKRRPKDEFWMGLKDIVDTLSGRPHKSHSTLDAVRGIAENKEEDGGKNAGLDLK
jgi:6-phosphofructokinase 1